jgi:cation transport ATPase
MAAPMVFGASWAGWLAFAATVPVQFVADWPFLTGAIQQARARTANMDTLIKPAPGTTRGENPSTARSSRDGPPSR